MTGNVEPLTMQPEDLFRLKFLQDAQLSPDGALVVYALLHVEVDETAEKESEREKDKTALWLLSLETNETRQLTTGQHKDSSPRWSPDGKRIAFVSDRADKSQIYLIAVDGGEAQVLTAMQQGVGGEPAWSPDGTQIAFTAPPLTELPDPDQPYRVTRHVYRFDQIGFLDEKVQDIYVVSAGGGDPLRLTKDDNMNGGLHWSPDGMQVLFRASFQPDSHRAFFGRLRAVNMNGDVRDITGDWGACPVCPMDAGRQACGVHRSARWSANWHQE